jgi:hypothetical protein
MKYVSEEDFKGGFPNHHRVQSLQSKPQKSIPVNMTKDEL